MFFFSGGHINPALTTAMLITRRISPVRAVMFIAAQCGGAVGGAAIIYRYKQYLHPAVSYYVCRMILYRSLDIHYFTWALCITYLISNSLYHGTIGFQRFRSQLLHQSVRPAKQQHNPVAAFQLRLATHVLHRVHVLRD